MCFLHPYYTVTRVFKYKAGKQFRIVLKAADSDKHLSSTLCKRAVMEELSLSVTQGSGYNTNRGATNKTHFIRSTKFILYAKWLFGRIETTKMNSAIAVRWVQKYITGWI
jgi:hypothetical protein